MEQTAQQQQELPKREQSPVMDAAVAAIRESILGDGYSATEVDIAGIMAMYRLAMRGAHFAGDNAARREAMEVKVADAFAAMCGIAVEAHGIADTRVIELAEKIETLMHQAAVGISFSRGNA